jgi:malonate-semialdehyde dehydrogenase (acetylating)/methylmalonate-semialdehyde dehydrogenase
VKEGAKLVVDGRGLKVPGHEDGFFAGGTLFDNVTPQMRIYKEEIFGPVLACVRVKDICEAVELINTHEFGNGVAYFTRDGHIAREFGRRIEVGMVGINVSIPVPRACASILSNSRSCSVGPRASRRALSLRCRRRRNAQ